MRVWAVRRRVLVLAARRRINELRWLRVGTDSISEARGLLTQRSRRAPEAGKMPYLHSAKSGQEIRAGDIFMLGDCAEEGGQSADS